MKCFLASVLFFISMLGSSTVLWSMEISPGFKQLYLQQTDGHEQHIGGIEFTALEAGQ